MSIKGSFERLIDEIDNTSEDDYGFGILMECTIEINYMEKEEMKKFLTDNKKRLRIIVTNKNMKYWKFVIKIFLINA